MPKYVLTILLLIAILPGLEAREPDISGSNGLFDRQQPVEKEQAGRPTWFGIGYESRREHADRGNFEDNALRNSVFSADGGSGSSPISSPGAISVNGGGRGAGGKR